MAHTFVNGFGGSVTLGSATYDVTDWSLTVNAEAVDTTNTGDAGWESNILGAKSWEGSAKSFWDSAADPAGTAFAAGVRATITLLVAATGKSYSGSCQLVADNIENPVKGAVAFGFNFKGTGPLTYPA
jgi:predicted secreted protein